MYHVWSSRKYHTAGLTRMDLRMPCWRWISRWWECHVDDCTLSIRLTRMWIETRVQRSRVQIKRIGGLTHKGPYEIVPDWRLERWMFGAVCKKYKDTSVLVLCNGVYHFFLPECLRGTIIF